MSRKLVDSFLAYDMHVMLQRFSHHPHRIDAGSWYLDIVNEILAKEGTEGKI